MIHVGLDRISVWNINDNKILKQIMNPDHAEELIYINNTPDAIYMSKRDGSRVLLKPRRHPEMSIGFFVYRTVRVIKTCLNEYMAVNAVEQARKNSKELELLHQQFGIRQENNALYATRSENRVGILYATDHHEINRRGGSMYIQELDVVLTTYRSAAHSTGGVDVPYHPYSREGVLHRQFEFLGKGVKATDAGFMYSMRIVDNARLLSRKYVRVGDHIVTVDPEQDTSLQDGVYVRFTDPNEAGAHEISGQTAERYDHPDNVPYFKFYNTREEAQTHGHNEAIVAAQAKLAEQNTRLAEVKAKELTASKNLETAQMQLDANREKYEFDKKRMEADMDRLQAERQRDAERFANDMAKIQADKEKLQTDLLSARQEAKTALLKAELERESAIRKNTAESFKTIPGIIFGIISVIGMLIKLFKPA